MKTQLGLEENIEAASCYLIGFITGIVFFVLEPDNKFVKFHAAQSIVTFLPLLIIGMMLQFTPVWFLGSLLWLLEIVLWIVLIIKAYQGERYKLPIVGDVAEQMSK